MGRETRCRPLGPAILLGLVVAALNPPAVRAAAVENPAQTAAGGALSASTDRQEDPASPEALGRTPEQHRTARLYARTGWTLAFVDPIWGMVTLAWIAFSGAGARIERFLATRIRPPASRDALFVVATVSLLALLNFPVEAARFWREKAFDFANQSVSAWFVDLCKGLVVAWVISVLLLVPLWAGIRRRPRTWWIPGSIVGIAASIVLILLTPVFIAPLFNTFTPLEDEALESRILSIANANGIPADDVFQVDASRQSSHDNAYVTGLFGTHRIVLYDTLLRAYTPDEIEFVMGHEMGHYLLNHIWKGIGLTSVVIFGGLYLLHRILNRTIEAFRDRLGFSSLSSIAALPLFLLFFSAFLFLSRPVSNAVSRGFEAQADRFAIRIMSDRPGGAAAGVSAVLKMAARNLSDTDPPAWIEFWLYSHPPMGRRIRACADAARENQPL